MGCGRSSESEGTYTGKPLLDGTPSASVKRKELQKLSKKDLRRRLRELGAAPSEGDGLGSKALADTVLLWNAMTRIRLCRGAERAAALTAIRREGIPKDILMRGLIVVGVPESERKEAKDKEKAAKLLHWTLAQDILKVCAVSLAKAKPPENDPKAMLPDVFREWRGLVGDREGSTDAALESNTAVNAAQVKLNEKRSKKDAKVKKDEGVYLNGVLAEPCTNDPLDLRKKYLQDHSGCNQAANQAENDNATRNALQCDEEQVRAKQFENGEASVRGQKGDSPTKSDKAPVTFKPEKSARDQKFEALDAELTSWLDSHGDEKEVVAAFKTLK